MSVDKLISDIREVLADIKSAKSGGEKGKDGGQMVALYGKWSIMDISIIPQSGRSWHLQHCDRQLEHTS